MSCWYVHPSAGGTGTHPPKSFLFCQKNSLNPGFNWDALSSKLHRTNLEAATSNTNAHCDTKFSSEKNPLLAKTTWGRNSELPPNLGQAQGSQGSHLPSHATCHVQGGPTSTWVTLEITLSPTHKHSGIAKSRWVGWQSQAFTSTDRRTRSFFQATAHSWMSWK